MTATGASLAERIEELAATPAGQPLPDSAEATIETLLAGLEAGTIRAESCSAFAPVIWPT